MKKILLLLTVLLMSAATFAAGPEKLAKSSRSLWPHPVNTPQLFDFASKMEILIYAKQMNRMDNMDAEALKAWLGLKNVNMDSVCRYSAEMKARLLQNTAAIRHQHKEDWAPGVMQSWEQLTALSEAQEKNLPEAYKAWYADADRFYTSYAYEQYRLAALFPGITSEILKIDPREYSGSEYKDKQFIMTFDDGPTASGGNTDATLRTLREAGKTGIFFILGTELNKRRNTDKLYAGMAVGTHGTAHKAHTKPDVWQNLDAFIKEAAALSDSESCWFRPPYGQRTLELVNYLDGKDCKVMLWNIDSQDWQKGITDTEMQDRLTSLMLMWRSGILLFHDVHPKASKALPGLWERFDGAGVIWE